jgi:hypothetical protein
MEHIIASSIMTHTNKCALPYVWHITSIIDFLKISVRIDDASDESSFKTLGVILSGPADLCGFKGKKFDAELQISCVFAFFTL